MAVVLGRCCCELARARVSLGIVDVDAMIAEVNRNREMSLSITKKAPHIVAANSQVFNENINVVKVLSLVLTLIAPSDSDFGSVID